MGNQSSFQILFSAGGNVDMQVRMSEEGRVHLERKRQGERMFSPLEEGESYFTMCYFDSHIVYGAYCSLSPLGTHTETQPYLPRLSNLSGAS